MSADTATVVDVQDVSHAYNDVSVLDAVSFALDAGSVNGIIGPNGSGKSTLLRILAGVLTPSSGAVEYASEEGHRAVGYLPQQPAYRAPFTVRETLSFYASLVDQGPSPDEALDLVGMGELADRRVDALSGGMIRLLGIAQATIGEPPLLVLDEPTSGLDPTMTLRIFDVLEELADAGHTILVAAHDLASVERSANRVLLLDRGRLQASGSPADLLAEYGVESLTDVFAVAVEESGGTTVRHGTVTP